MPPPPCRLTQADVEALSYSVLDEHDHLLFTTHLGTPCCEGAVASTSTAVADTHAPPRQDAAAAAAAGKAAKAAAAASTPDFGRRENETRKE
jgi:hypothetical protein